jgi:hypothetical protein
VVVVVALVQLAAMVEVLLLASVALVLQHIHLGVSQQQQVKTFLQLFTMQAVVAVVGAMAQLNSLL